MHRTNPKEIEKKDRHWTEVLELAKRYGFICRVNGDTVILSTNRRQIERLGEKRYMAIQGQVNAEIFGLN